jgi:hypothetical protein
MMYDVQEGAVAELDDPRILMHREGSIFRAMCQVRVMLFHVCLG